MIQQQLFEGCRELNYDKVLQAIDSGADVNLKAPIKFNYGSTDAQCSYDISVYESHNSFYTPLSLIAMHGARKIGTESESDSKACKIAELLVSSWSRSGLL